MLHVGLLELLVHELQMRDLLLQLVDRLLVGDLLLFEFLAGTLLDLLAAAGLLPDLVECLVTFLLDARELALQLGVLSPQACYIILRTALLGREEPIITSADRRARHECNGGSGEQRRSDDVPLPRHAHEGHRHLCEQAPLALLDVGERSPVWTTWSEARRASVAAVHR